MKRWIATLLIFLLTCAPAFGQTLHESIARDGDDPDGIGSLDIDWVTFDDTNDIMRVNGSFRIDDDVIRWNQDAAESGSDWWMEIGRLTTGMTDNLRFVFPGTGGTSGQGLATDGGSGTNPEVITISYEDFLTSITLTTVDTGFTEGSVVFIEADGSLGEDNADFLYTVGSNLLTVTNATVSTNLTLSNLTQNSVLFVGASGLIIEDATGFVYIDATDELGVGTSSPQGSAGGSIHIQGTLLGITPDVNADDLIIENDGDVGISLTGASTDFARIMMGDDSDSNIGQIEYSNIDDDMEFTAGTVAILTLSSTSGSFNDLAIINVSDISLDSISADGTNIAMVLGSGDFIVDTDTFVIDGSLARIGIGIAVPIQEIHAAIANSSTGLILERIDGSVNANQDIGKIEWFGGEAGSLAVGTILVEADTTNWSDSNSNTRMVIKITANGAVIATEVARFTRDGDFGLNDTTPDAKLDVVDSTTSAFVTILENASSSDDKEILQLLFSGDATISTNDEWIEFRSLLGVEGDIDLAVVYNTFTGAHIYYPGTQDFSRWKLGMLMKTTGRVLRPTTDTLSASLFMASVVASVIPTSVEKDPMVIGAFSGLKKSDKWRDRRTGLAGKPEPFARVNALGDGRILVSTIEGFPQNGDLICSSNIRGFGMRQDDDLIHSYTVAKLTETVNWDRITETVTHEGVQYKIALVACVYRAGG